MRNLLLKEYMVNRSTIFISFIAMIFLGTIMFTSEDSLPPVAIAVLFILVILVSSGSVEQKNDSDVLINSLPVTRRQIVATKFMFPLVLGIVFIAYMAGVRAALSLVAPVAVAPVSVASALFALVAIGLFTAVYYPLNYLLGPRFMQIGLVVFYLLTFFAFPMLLNIARKYAYWGLLTWWQQTSPVLIALCAAAVTALILVTSWLLTTRVYEQKNF
ncbi:ABC-2 transporter permease [Numidum massiliense]|uniref:ABC-2 transporter permease n=1 Tax=Numidum massiliense TaxID=1522315 RepID=UPI0006D56A71|nr:ABC-2 transporter permease [Numidum massiliense]